MFDAFAGSGTTLVAAERTGRRAKLSRLAGSPLSLSTRRQTHRACRACLPDNLGGVHLIRLAVPNF
ncbi:hypothetical protein, partial [uncultured Sphingorhabdus sp.]|uniref:hypothetical protein n=1 Tax=uncultured Sphingorhabdus sp. TaxID=1686106 RepID=UPI00345CFE70